MNIQEAIRTLKEFDLTEDEQNEIIELLQQGEKYKKMWEELSKKYGAYSINESYQQYLTIGGIIKELEQKYFPKEEK